MDTMEPKVVTSLAPSAPQGVGEISINYLFLKGDALWNAPWTRWHGSCLTRGPGAVSMRGATENAVGRIEAQFPAQAGVTLLELVSAICDVTEDEQEILATVHYLLESGTVRLCGNLRGIDPKLLRS